MASASKKAYMRGYNLRAEVKARKAAYMRRVRQEREGQAHVQLVRTLLDIGYQNLAEEYALERCPEMLLTVKASARKPKPAKSSLH